MKTILAALLSVMLCMQTASAGLGNLVFYTDSQEDVREETQTQEEIQAQDGEESQEEAQSQEEAETQGEIQNQDGEEAQKEGEGTEENQEGQAALVEISAPSAILMEASTGKVIYEKNPDEERPPASVTKIMTLLLIFDALESGKITLEDQVSVSEYAASMGGSQVFLEPGETQSVDTMIKCIAVASANDACVAMAEYISGNEEEFVNQMNKRAKDLDMEHTNFVNCNGLDTDGHLTTARDIALMSRALITTYPKIRDYSMIWMENITHTTNKGTSEFGLTNTNKLVRQYEYTTGLKTGSTDKAKFCVSATAEKNQMELIAVVMAAPEPKARFKDATALLNYGFGKCMKYIDEGIGAISPVSVTKGVEKEVHVKQAGPFNYIDTTGADLGNIKKKNVVNDNIKAPVKKGDKVGEVEYYLGDEKIGSVDIVASEGVEKIDYKNALEDALEGFFL